MSSLDKNCNGPILATNYSKLLDEVGFDVITITTKPFKFAFKKDMSRMVVSRFLKHTCFPALNNDEKLCKEFSKDFFDLLDDHEICHENGFIYYILNENVVLAKKRS